MMQKWHDNYNFFSTWGAVMLEKVVKKHSKKVAPARTGMCVRLAHIRHALNRA